MKEFRGFRAKHEIAGNETDSYYKLLPDHDLSALANYFSKVVKKKDIRNVLDVGANIGLSSIIMSEISPRSKIYAFEPSAGSFEHLRSNVQRNLFQNEIYIHQCAVGASIGSVKFIDVQSNASSNHISTTDEGVDVELTSIDAFFDGNKDFPVDFIKIDVEGFEVDVLKGGEHTFLRHRPIVFVEFNPFAIDSAGMDSVEKVIGDYRNFLGPLGVIDPVTGDVSILPNNSRQAADHIKNMMQNDFTVFDLTNFAA